MMRAAPLFVVAVLMVLLVAMVPLGGSHAASAPRSSTRVVPAHGAVPATIRPANCTVGWLGYSAYLAVDIGANSSLNGSYQPIQVGDAPAVVNLSLVIYGGSAPWTYNVSFGDGASTAGFVVSNFSGNSTGSTFVNVSHTFALPATYTPGYSLNFTCGNYGGGLSGSGPQLVVGGPGGYFPVTASVNVTNGSVPLPVQYSAVINDTPANATIVWFLANPLGYLVVRNVTSLNETLAIPGLWSGAVDVFYPGGAILYGQAILPIVTVNPSVVVTVTQSAPSGGGSNGTAPISITFFANVTAVNGTPYTGTGNLTWNFSSFWSQGNFSLIAVSGPTTGSEVTETFTPQHALQNFVIGFPASTRFVEPTGTTLGWTFTPVSLFWGNQGGGNGFSLTLGASPNNGTAPFSTNLTVSASPALPSNVTGLYGLNLCITPQGNVTGNFSCAAFEDNVTNWTGNPIQVPVTGLAAGSYVVSAVLLGPAGPNGSAQLASTWTYLYVRSAGTGGAPSALVVSATGSPSNGTAPLAASLGVEAAGGSAPYQLSVCVEGPSATPPVTGTCTPAASSSGWNGSALSIPLALNLTGYYLVIATVTDSGGNVTNTSVGFKALAPATAAPLQVRASDQASATTAGTYVFLATINGGVAPYAIQWAFGDGSYGSSTAGGTVSHTYTVSGSYTATLIVTDAHGTVRTSTVGPLVVLLPTTSGTSVLSGTYIDVLVGSVVVIVASLAVIVYAARTAAERRRTEAWMASVEAGSPPSSQPPNRPGQ